MHIGLFLSGLKVAMFAVGKQLKEFGVSRSNGHDNEEAVK